MDRKSCKSDVVAAGFAPTRAVARDMARLLHQMERRDSLWMVKSDKLGDHLNDVQTQLLSIAARLRGHYDDSASDVENEPTLADKGKVFRINRLCFADKEPFQSTTC